MSSDTLQSAIASIRSGDKETGKLLLADLTGEYPRNKTAWLPSGRSAKPHSAQLILNQKNNDFLIDFHVEP